MVWQSTNGFKKMVLELKKLSDDEKIKQQMEARADYESRIATARGAGYREGLEEGIEQGIETGTINTLIKLVAGNIIDEKTAAKQAGISVKEFEKILYER